LVTTVVIAGIPVPSSSPLFLAVVGMHVAFGVVAVAAGALAMLSAKRPGRHPRAGTVYFWSLAGLFVTASGLAAVRWREDWRLFLLALIAFAAALVGRIARRRLRPGWPAPHILGMGVSYIAMLTAFYVDNGPNLPVWRDLPHLAYWLLPSLLGAPVIALALGRHPIARAARRAMQP